MRKLIKAAFLLLFFFSINYFAAFTQDTPLPTGEAAAESIGNSPTSEYDWPMYQHDPGHSGRTPATAFNDGPLFLQWAYSFGERVEVEAQPISMDGIIYQGVMNGKMHAINASTGEAIWVAQPGGPIAHTAAVYGDKVYFGSLDGRVYALHSSNGGNAWQFPTGGPVVSAPAVVDGRLYIGSNDGNLYALNADTGAELWRVETDGPVISSPAVANGRVYFGSEDLTARCVNAVTGAPVWATPLQGAGMHNTHPVLSDDGTVVIFLTIKPGATPYVPLEGYPDAPQGANPVTTWNNYYQSHPTHRYLYYLSASTGADLWAPTASPPRYVPLPIPYWGLLHPILAPDGSAVFPAPAGTEGHSQVLDHDYRLFQVNLATGTSVQIAGGDLPEFQLQLAETGRHVFSGNDYYFTISEDLGVYRPSNGTRRALFTNGDPSGYNFGTHMHPHSPLPSRHLWRYGGAISMGGVPGASPPIVANNMIYFNSYSWLYAVGPTNHGYDPATSFPARDEREYELTYPRSQAPTPSDIHAEVEQRVAEILALGPNSPPMTAKWEQAGERMLNNEFTYELFGFEADLVRVLSEAYPFLSSTLQGQVRSYLSSYIAGTLLNWSEHYTFGHQCIIFGEEGMQSGESVCLNNDKVSSHWMAHNNNLVGLRLYALWAYADATGNWATISSNWNDITQQFQSFVNAYDPSLGFCDFSDWRSRRLSIGAQISAAQAVRDMAAVMGDSNTEAQAQNLLNNLLNGRVALAQFVPNLYLTGQRQVALIRLNANGTINNDDIHNGPYNNELIPYDPARRDQYTDSSQVNWWDGSSYRVDAGTGFMYYPSLSGYFPLTSELADRLSADLYNKTQYYVKSYEVNNPWWWMSDLAHHSTGSGEYLYHSPTLAWTIFQVKARVLHEDWDTLAHQLPEPVSYNSRYDLYRLQNLVTLLEMVGPNLYGSKKSVSNIGPQYNEVVDYTITVQNDGTPFYDSVRVTDTIPAGLSYVPGSLSASLGEVDDSHAPTLYWTGVMSEVQVVSIQYNARVVTQNPQAIVNTAQIETGSAGVLERSAALIANGRMVFLPLCMRERTS